MASKWIVSRQTNVQSSDRRSVPVWLFPDKAAADAWARRLGRAAAQVRSMYGLEEPWQGSDHEDWKAGALATLQGLDPAGENGARYEVFEVAEFVAPQEPAPANGYQAWFRQARDAG